MSNSASPSSLKFLLDENVKLRLLSFLKAKGFDAIKAAKRSLDEKLALLSKLEQRIFVTGDSDFADSEQYPKERIFSVIWLRVPQDKPELLLKSFSNLLSKVLEPEDFEGNLITLYEEGFKVTPISSKLPSE